MQVVAGIPARMGSSRLPGKPLRPILGRPMIEHVYARTSLAPSVNATFVATCDQEILDAVVGFGGRAIMTPREISRPGLRVATACESLDLADEDLVVVVQGDEPLVHPDMIELAIRPFVSDKSLQVLTLIASATEDEWVDADEVKTVQAANGDILYMSRSPLPSNARGRVGPRFKQVAIIPFRRGFLRSFQTLAATPLEIAESIELLRALEHGYRVGSADSSAFHTVSVDTSSDLAEAEALMRIDSLHRELFGGRLAKSRD